MSNGWAVMERVSRWVSRASVLFHLTVAAYDKVSKVTGGIYGKERRRLSSNRHGHRREMKRLCYGVNGVSSAF